MDPSTPGALVTFYQNKDPPYVAVCLGYSNFEEYAVNVCRLRALFDRVGIGEEGYADLHTLRVLPEEVLNTKEKLLYHEILTSYGISDPYLKKEINDYFSGGD